MASTYLTFDEWLRSASPKEMERVLITALVNEYIPPQRALDQEHVRDKLLDLIYELKGSEETITTKELSIIEKLIDGVLPPDEIERISVELKNKYRDYPTIDKNSFYGILYDGLSDWRRWYI